ncbi:metal ABC transporter permease [Leptolinea tardivitalis]|uniref:Manganese ABC transporter permease n=1 Tax=Leptolinea tardivitalis TaxID=229920 RepID=A0A0P6WWV6_9CHLR|nr:metal ABC transporter permease [Leptolinea tardivitalis]KPL74751.1 manganese ABC transporter permease [Leptolinea tardivitalis]GAP22877.1 ABC-type Mn2+/Zn2+ transport system, permease component [Leptolinea tardivitalis]
MITWITQPLMYEFMQRGLLAAVIVGLVCSIIGCYVVLRSMAFLGDALAHAILPGIAIAYLFGGNLMIGALVASILVALAIGFFSKHGTIREDTAIGVLFSAALALGIAIISTIRTYAVDLSHILFGDVLGVSSSDLIQISILAFVIIMLVLVFYRPFKIISFDPVLATTLKLPAEQLRTLLLILISLTIVTSLQTVGIGLVAAMLVTPAASAFLLTNRLSRMMLVSAGIGVLSSVLGLYISYYVSIASGSAIVLVSTLIFIFSYLFSPRKGILRVS